MITKRARFCHSIQQWVNWTNPPFLIMKNMTVFSDNPIGDDHHIPTTALWLGLSGLIPFMVGGLLAVTAGAGVMTAARADLFLIGYGATILSFMAGSRWGLALTSHNPKDQSVQLAVSVIPSLTGWFSLLLPFSFALPLLTLAHAALGVWDIRAMHGGRGPRWYGRLRMILTSAVVILLVVIGVVRLVTLQNAS